MNENPLTSRPGIESCQDCDAHTWVERDEDQKVQSLHTLRGAVVRLVLHDETCMWARQNLPDCQPRVIDHLGMVEGHAYKTAYQFGGSYAEQQE